MRLLDRFLRRDCDDDLQAEIQAHLSMAAQDRMSAGEDPTAARLGAVKEFGNVTLIREATGVSWGSAWRAQVADVAQDLRYAVRTLGRTPAYALVIMAVLSLGIGANVSVFSVFKALALTPILSEGGNGRTGSSRRRARVA